MDNENSRERALKVYAALCGNMDELGWRYEKNEEQLSVKCCAQGKDLSMDISLEVNEQRQLILLLSYLPFIVSEERRVDMAVAVSVINSRLADGCFDYEIRYGQMIFRMTNSYCDSIPGRDLFSYMLLVSCKIIDEFNDKFMMLATGTIDLEKFIEIVDKA